MIEVIFFEHGQNEGRKVSAKPGVSLMQAALAGGVEGVAADCGGTLTCATCHVLVREPWHSQLPPMLSDEEGMLDFAAVPRQACSRLSCQVILTSDLNGMEVDLPESQY